MKKIKDERLVIKNLENIRIVYLIQTTGIIGILAYEFITKGFDGVTGNPLWFVFIISAIVSSYLSMNISVEHENNKKSPKKGLIISLIVIGIISIVIGIAAAITDGFTTGITTGSIILICGIVPVIYIYFLRKRDDN